MKQLVACSAMRRLVLFLVTACVLVPAVPGRAAFAEDTEAQKAAKEIADARERANAANEAYFDAESELDSLSIEAQTLEAEIAELQSQVDVLQSRVQQMAHEPVHPFVDEHLALAQRLCLAGGADAGGSAVRRDLGDVRRADFDEFDSLNSELADKQAELADKQRPPSSSRPMRPRCATRRSPRSST
jgi:chromosome segregation ATPase